MEPSIERLLEPISADSPCGEDLEDSALLASFDAYRVFGHMTPHEDEVDWRELRDRSLEALATSKDLRLLAYLAAAVLRTGGLPAFCDVLRVAEGWFEAWPEALYPRVDEDAILRRNALNGFADRVAMLDALRRRPLLSNPQLGAFSLRDLLVARGQMTLPEGTEHGPGEREIRATLSAATAEELQALAGQLRAALAAADHVAARMRDANGVEAAPDFDPLRQMLGQMLAPLDEELAARAPAGATAGNPAAAAGGPQGGGTTAIAVGGIESRQDAIRALDAVAEYFRRNEPSSPVPLLVERAKRLVGKDLLEVLADLAPGALEQAMQAAGVRSEGEQA